MQKPQITIEELIKTILKSKLTQHEISLVIKRYKEHEQRNKFPKKDYIDYIIHYIKLWLGFGEKIVSVTVKRVKNEIVEEKFNDRLTKMGKIWHGFLDFLEKEVKLDDLDEIDINFINLIDLKGYKPPKTGDIHLIGLFNNLVSIIMTIDLVKNPHEVLANTAEKEDLIKFMREFKKTLFDWYPVFEKSTLILSELINRKNPKRKLKKKIADIFLPIKNSNPELFEAINDIRFVKNSLISHSTYVFNPYPKGKQFLDYTVVFFNLQMGLKKKKKIAKKLGVPVENVGEINKLTIQELLDLHENMFYFIRIQRVFCSFKLGLWIVKKIREAIIYLIKLFFNDKS